MKKALVLALALFVVFGLGCRHTDGGGRAGRGNGWIPQPQNPPVRNTLRSATFKSHLYKAVDAKTYTLDMSQVPSMYQDEIRFYLVNALSHRDMAFEPKARFIIKVELTDSNIGLNDIRGIKSRQLGLKMAGFDKRELNWTVEVNAHGRPNTIANSWLPGMVAVATYYMGQSRGGMQNIANIPTALFEVNNFKR